MEINTVSPTTLTDKYYFVLTVNIGSNPGLAAIWEDEQQRRREANESSHITAPPSDGENV